MSVEHLLSLDDEQKWKYYFNQLPYKDVFFTYEYNLLISKTFGYVPEVYIREGPEDFLFFPYMKLKLNELPFYKYFQDDLPNEDLWDITSMEYGGPVRTTSNGQFNTEFEHNFRKYCSSNHILTGFIRLHPFAENHRFIESSHEIKEVHYVDLSKSYETIRSEYDKSNRNCINKAEREGVTIRFSQELSDYKSFYELYTEAMTRIGAREFYFYSDEFIELLPPVMGDKIGVYQAEFEGSLIGSSLVLRANGVDYYFLSARDTDYSKYCATNAILDRAIKDSKEQGSTAFVLGGGNSAGDSLSRFKSKFTSTSRSFYLYKDNFNPDLVDILSRKRLEYDSIHGNETNENYFPVYRSP